jgi:hypothetical protein
VVRQGFYYRGYGTEPEPPVPGSWTCRDVRDAVTSCATGRVRTAAFTPTTPFTPLSDYQVELNPEHTLGLVDMAGNPAQPGGRVFRTSGAQ